VRKCGIDLGTTYSSIGWYDPGRQQVDVATLMMAANGRQLLPSAVFVEGPDRVIVGDTATNAGVMRPDRLFRWFKRELGQSLGVTLDGRVWTPTECSTEVLRTLKEEAERYWDDEVNDVVITFPAFFTPQQKDLTREAAVRAGLNVINMIEEPVAAALAYLIEQTLERARREGRGVEEIASIVPGIIDNMAGEGRGLLVYDLGGGTFDVALVQAWGVKQADGNVDLHTKVLCNDGNIELGGKNWDEALRGIVVERDIRDNGHDPMGDMGSVKLDEYCEQAKRDMGVRPSVDILCPRLHKIQVTKKELEEATSGKLEATRNVIRGVIARAEAEFNIRRENLTLLLSGGMCMWPAVREMLTEVMDGREPTVPRNVNLMVTYGASYLAYLTVVPESRDPGSRTGDKDGIVIPGSHDVIKVVPTEVPYPAIGVEVIDEADPKLERLKISMIIPSESTVGTEYSHTYSNPFENMTTATIKLYFLKRGHLDTEEDLSAWSEYKTFHMKGLPAVPADKWRLDVTLAYQQGGVIDGTAAESGNKISITGETRNYSG